MNANDIARYEAEFNRTGKDSDGKFHTLIPQTIQIPGETGQMNYTFVRPLTGDQSFFYEKAFDKVQIVLHFTMGYLPGDVATLTKKNYHVSVPFIIGRNGIIYNLFSSQYWSYHLGEGAMGGNDTRSKVTIGIEISNIGPLKRNGDRLVTTYGENDTYCSLDETHYFEQISFRGHDYFASFTEAQYVSLGTLLRYLTTRFDIAREILPENRRFQALQEVVDFNGIVTHVNYRVDGKWDIGPAFNWDRLISEFQPQIQRTDF
jgi:N-acetyl-anhydromuramyl-L-alanine amidase AmpD